MNNCQQVLNHFASLVPDSDADMQKRLVTIWSEDEQIRNFMLFDDIPGKDSPDIHEKPQKKKSVEKKEKSEKSTPFSPLKFLKDNPDVKIEFSGTKSGKNAEIFEKYKTATTFAEFVELARSVRDENPNGHITSDYKTGQLKIHHPDVPSISPKSKKTPVKEKKEKKEKKEIEKTEEKSEPTLNKSPIPEQSPIPEEENIEEKTIKKDKKDKKDKKKKNKKKKDKEKKVDEISSPSESVEPVSSRPDPGKVKNAVQKMEGKNDEVSENIVESPKSSPSFQDEDDDDWPTKTVDGVTYDYNESDGLLIDKESGIQIGYLDPDGTIDYIGTGEEIHEQNQDKL